MNIETWKKDPKLTEWAAATFASPMGKQFMTMMTGSNPKNYQRTTIQGESEASLALGAIYGYDVAVNNIESACIETLPDKAIEESWGTELPLTAKTK